jgi:hypothetical protein
LNRVPTEVEFLESFMAKQTLKFFRKDERKAIENGKMPVLSQHFDTYGPFISQEQFWQSYFSEHEPHLAAFADTAELMAACRARAYRAYPSLMREHHLYLSVRDRLDYEWVERNSRLDMAGIDLLIVANAQAFGVHAYIDSAESNYYRARKGKRYRKIGHTVELALDRKTAPSIGQFQVYGADHLAQLQAEIAGVLGG